MTSKLIQSLVYNDHLQRTQPQATENCYVTLVSKAANKVKDRSNSLYVMGLYKCKPAVINVDIYKIYDIGYMILNYTSLTSLTA